MRVSSHVVAKLLRVNRMSSADQRN